MIGLRREIWTAARRIVTSTLCRGRIIRLSVLLDKWTHMVNVHIDPALPLSTRRRVLHMLAEDCRRCEGTVLVGGDWNFVAGGDARERLGDQKIKDDEGMNGLFDDLFGFFGELAQQEMTFRRLPRDLGGAIVFSRIDRIYCNLHLAAVSKFAFSIGVRSEGVLRMPTRRATIAQWLCPCVPADPLARHVSTDECVPQRRFRETWRRS